MLVDTIRERVFLTDSCIARFWDVADKFVCLPFPPARLQQHSQPHDLPQMPCAQGQDHNVSRTMAVQDALVSFLSLPQRNAIRASGGGCRSRDGVLEFLIKFFHHLFSSSQIGWGAHLWSLMAAGTWLVEERTWHVIILKVKMDLLALIAFKDRLIGERLVLMNNNATCGILEKAGGNIVSELVQDGSGCRVVWCPQHLHLGKVHSWEKEHSGGSVKSSRSDHSYRVVSSSQDVRGCMQDVQLSSRWSLWPKQTQSFPFTCHQFQISWCGSRTSSSTPWDILTPERVCVSSIHTASLDSFHESGCSIVTTGGVVLRPSGFFVRVTSQASQAVKPVCSAAHRKFHRRPPPSL